MKTLYIIGGTMGVGKSAVCEILNKKLPKCVYLDGDWCWNMHPFVVTEETKRLVKDNICHSLNNFIACSEFENILFCWVLHEQCIIDEIVSRIDSANLKVVSVSLTASETVLKNRLQKDIDAGLRENDVIARSVARLPLYDKLRTVKIDTDNLTLEQVAQKIISLTAK